MELFIYVLSTIALISGKSGEAEGKYVGAEIGKLNVYHHGVGGLVFAVNDSSILIQNFNYDGLGKDTFFWAGQSGTPSAQGFIVPDQWGRTNVLEKYDNADIVLTLPDGKKLGEIKWFAVFDLTRMTTFGDVTFPDGFAPPEPHSLGPFTSRSDDLGSESVQILDSKRFHLSGFTLFYDDGVQVYFWVGKGHSPSPRGRTILADEDGYLEPLRRYSNEELILTLPGDLTIDSIDWLAVYDVTNSKPLGYVTIPSEVNVPPNLAEVRKSDRSLPNCEQLHDEVQVVWDVTGQTITFELIALMGDGEWAGFGVSGGGGSEVKMVGGDVAIGWIGRNGQGMAVDMNMDAQAVCTRILDTQPHGVCPDTLIGKSDSIQLLEARRSDGLTTIKFRRQLTVSETNDKVINSTLPAIWAIGPIINDSNFQFGFHRIYNKGEKLINLTQGGEIECRDFVIPMGKNQRPPWGEVKIVDGKLRAFTARLGPSGGPRGYEALTGLPSPGLSWYIHGYLAPTLFMQRGLTYSFRVEGGNSPQSVQTYHPFVIATGPNPSTSIILAGVETTRRGLARPTASGRLCLWTHLKDRRRDSGYPTFEKYRNSLKLRCENGSEPGILEVSPNSSWPDTVYYGSYSAPNMGWKIHVVDNLNSDAYSGGSRSLPQQISFSFLVVLVVLILIPDVIFRME